MKCNNCGFEHEEAKNFCPKCGNSLTYEVISLNPMADRVSVIFKSGMFLTICILLTAGSVFSLLSGGGIPVFPILYSIFLWLCYAQGKKGFTDQTHLRSISGTTFAYYIVEYVAAGLLVLCGLLCMLGTSAVSEELIYLLEAEGLISSELPYNMLGLLCVILSVILLMSAVAVILINVFGVRKIHKFIQSVYKSIEYNQNQIVCAKTARTWLIIFGSFGIASAFLSLLSLSTISAAYTLTSYEAATTVDTSTIFASVIANACSGISGIFAGVLIHKHLINTNI